MHDNLQVWLAQWAPDGGEPTLVSLAHEAEDGHAAFFAAGVVARKCATRGAGGLHATNALVGGAEGVLVYALHSPWAAFVPRLRLRGGEVAHSTMSTPLRGAEAVC
jgi:hypothetical protein